MIAREEKGEILGWTNSGVMWNKVEYDLKDSQKMVGQLYDCSYSKGIKIVLNGRNFKYHLRGDRFHMLRQAYKFYHGLCLNNLLQVLLIVIQRDHVPPLIYSNRDDEVSHLVIGRKLPG